MQIDSRFAESICSLSHTHTYTTDTGTAHLRDCGSTHGSFVNGERVASDRARQLFDGSVLFICLRVCVFIRLFLSHTHV